MFAFLMGLKSISPRELLQRIEARQQPLTVIDVNSAQSWAKAHVPGALHLDPQAFNGADLPTDKQASVVFYCSNPLCRKAPNAARRAKQMGYTDARVMSAGISGWIDAGLPTQAG
jgi:rhodanese-related sulfurtransferase